MSLKSFDISYGFNGEPSSASLSYAYMTKTKEGVIVHEDIGSLGEEAATSEPQLNEAIKNFIIGSKKTTKEAGFVSVSYELVDFDSKRLGSIAVLVRGITASPIGNPLKGMKRIFNASEFIDEDNPRAVGIVGDKDVRLFNNGQIAVIGRTFSVVSAALGDDSASVFYSGGKLVGQNPKGDLSEDMKEVLRENVSSCSIQYGYYLSDFESLLRKLGYSAINFPKEDDFMILNFGGSLRDCISSIASMFGLYWISRGAEILFYKSADLQKLTIENFNNSTDSKILSSSYSEDLLGKGSVGVIVGTVTNHSNSQNFSFNEKNIKVTFLPIEIQTLLSKEALYWVRKYLTLFRLSEAFDFFNKIVILQMLDKKSEIKENGLYTKYYEGKGLPEDVKATSIEKLESKEKNIKDLKDAFPFLNELSSLYPMKTEAGPDLQLPDTTPIFALTKAACMIFGSFYISKRISETKAKRYSVIAEEDISVSRAYKAKTKLIDIAEMTEFVNLLRATLKKDDQDKFDENTLDDLYELIKDKKNGKSKSVLTAENSYHFVAIKPLFKRKEDLEDYPKDIKEAVLAIEEGVKEGRGVFVNTSRGGYLATSAGEITKVQKILETSGSLFDRLESSKEGKKAIYLEASRIKKEKTTDVEDEDLSIYNSEYKSFVVRANSSPLSEVSVSKFDGNIDEAKYLESKFDQILDFSFKAKESSVAYDGIVIPEFSPVLSSVSISFSDGSASTTITKSNKEFLAPSEEVIMAGYSVYGISDTRSKLIARQRNFWGIT